MRSIGLVDRLMQRIGRVIEHLEREYARADEMEELAQLAGMSVSSF